MTASLSADEQRVLDNLQRVEERLRTACMAAGRRRDEVTLMAVTKTVPPELINTVLDAGVTCIGENRVQEYLSKCDVLHLEGVERHLIGHLQTNKVRRIVGEVDMIQSVDSVHLAKAISDAAKMTKRGVIDVLVEVNIGGEESKSGVSPESLTELLDKIAAFDGIRVRGLMTIPPIFHTEFEKRAIFYKMHKLFIDIQGKKVDNGTMELLSMGMSSDFAEAVLEGSTLVRVGSAIFGERQYK
ncbi:MAG: YggS family pyridoxal phosphate-dependent enzyme [Clostridia bacterium]|nr:YggS family pyridoxal phosphate-dependent enzyme [Clostridia bacterium]